MENSIKDTQKIVIGVREGHEHELFKNQNILKRNTLMYPAYQAALEALEGIIKSTREWHEEEKSKKHKSHKKHEDMDLYGYANNIIAFCGNRGHGKTSAMLSFTSALMPCCYENPTDEWTKENEKELREKTQGCRFFVLPPIDPTMLQEQDTIIRLVLSNLLKETENLWETHEPERTSRDDEKLTEAEKYQTLRRFQNCLRGLGMESREAAERRTEFDNFAQSNDVFTLKNNIYKIVMHLFKLLGWEGETSFLVVQLDDTDMHMERAYEMVEYVRKYLCIPNVVVVMATDITQLRALVNHSYKSRLNCRSDNEIGFNLEYISAKYIDKLIPVPQTIHLPTLKSQRDMGKKLVLLTKDDSAESSGSGKETDIQIAIFDLIYQKTGLVFIKHTAYMHEIIPSSLRGYMHLYRFLYSMPNPQEASLTEAAENPQEIDAEFCKRRLRRMQQMMQNLSKFEDYFLNEWVPSRILDGEDRSKVQDLKDVAFSRLSQYIVQYSLPAYGSSDEKCPDTDKHCVKADIDKYRVDIIAKGAKDRQVENAQGEESEDGKYAKFLNALSSHINNNCLTSEQYNYTFAVGTYFSIQLHKNSMADEINALQSWIADLEKSGNISPENRKIKFDNLLRMVTGSDKPDENAGWARIEKALKTAEEGPGHNEFDKGGLAQGLLELLNDEENLNEKDKIKKILNNYNENYNENYQENSDSENPISLQIAIIFYCCNWDVLYQIYDNVYKYSKYDDQIEGFVKETADLLRWKIEGKESGSKETGDAAEQSKIPLRGSQALFKALLEKAKQTGKQHEDAAGNAK